MNVPDQLRYAESHEWLRLESDGTAVLGITDHAQNELTDIVFVDLPQIGKQLVGKEVVAVVESVKAASDIYIPIAGEVVESNAALSTDPALINTDPYGEGWICRIKPTNPTDLEAMLDADAYRTRIG